MLGHIKEFNQRIASMSQLTFALEKLSQAIDKLEQAVDGRIARLESQQKDLFSQVEAQRDQSRRVTGELDEIIAQLETTLSSAASENNSSASVR